jgi:Domain of unknown function (DUF4292)
MNLIKQKFPESLMMLLGATVLMFSGCQGSKMALESSTPLTVLSSGAIQKLEKNAFKYSEMSLKIKVDYNDGNLQQGFNMNIKMIRDSAIWASISAFGIEISRAYVTADSFKMIDRLRKQYVSGNLSELKQYTKQEFTLAQLQDLFIGNAFYPTGSYEQFNDELRNDHLKYQDSLLWNALILTEGFRIKTSELENAENTQNVVVDYDKFKKIKKSGSLATKLKLDLSGNGRKMELKMNYVTVSTDPVGNLNFTVPSKYAKGM